MRYTLTMDFLVLFEKVASDCDVDRSTTRYCVHRLKNEGLSFWTVTLPNLSKAVLYGIEVGSFTREVGPGQPFTSIQWKGRSLRFFRSLLNRIFCQQTGVLLSNPCPVALRCLRQLTEYCYKLAFAFNDLQKEKAEKQYLGNQVFGSSFRCCPKYLDRLRRSAETNYPYLFKDHTHDILKHGPRFGPGAFRRQPMPGDDYPFYQWKMLDSSLVPSHDEVFGAYSGYFKPYPGAPTRLKPFRSERIAEVLFVPKDSRGPRVISKEPPLILKAQMAFFSWMTSLLERNTLGRINFSDQTRQRELAKLGSIDGSIATLDLKNGSDRVWLSVVRSIFRNAPGVRFFLRNGRSTMYQLPSGKLGRQHAVAGMGSGLTFPIMSFLIHLTVCTYVSDLYRLSYDYVARRVRTFGDDLIIPTEWTKDAYAALSAVGLAVNISKSYSSGPFRESCGGDYLNGVDVTPVRLKLASANILVDSLGGKSLKLSHYFAKNEDLFLVNLSAHRNECQKHGLISTVEYYDSLLSKAIPYPVVGVGSPVLGRETDSDDDVYRQVHGSQMTSVMAVTKSALTEHFDEMCPYKYLSSALKPSESTCIYPTDAGSRAGFGEIAVPRAVKLKKRRVNLADLLPRRQTVDLSVSRHPWGIPLLG